MGSIWTRLGLLATAIVIVVLTVWLSGGGSSGTPSTAEESNERQAVTDTLGSGVVSPATRGTTIYWAEGPTIYRRPIGSDKKTVVASLTFSPTEVIWSPSGESALLRQGGEPDAWLHVQWSALAAMTQLNLGVLTPAWSADGKRVLYSFSGAGGTPLAVADPDGTDWQVVFDPGHTLGQVWWPGNGVYAIGRDYSTTPSRYVRILLSSKRLETLAEAGDDNQMGAVPNPAGTQVVLDGAEATAPTLQLSTLEVGSVESIGVLGTTNRVAWQDDSTLIAITNENVVVSVAVATKKITTLGRWPSAVPVPDQLVAATKDVFVVVTNDELREVSRSLVKPR